MRLQMAAELPRRSLSSVLIAVVWTLLSCGILLAFCFLLFTLRFKNNRYSETYAVYKHKERLAEVI